MPCRGNGRAAATTRSPRLQTHASLQVNPLRVKKLHVLAALEVDKFKKKTLDLNPAVTQHTAGGRTMQPSATMQKTAAQTLNSGCCSPCARRLLLSDTALNTSGQALASQAASRAVPATCTCASQHSCKCDSLLAQDTSRA